MSLPPAAANQPFCRVSALHAGSVDVPLAWALDGVQDNERVDVPALAFLVQHSTNNDKLLVDLGIPKDWEQSLPPAVVQYIAQKLGFKPSVPQDVVEALAKGGAKPSDITHVLYTHLHFDHIGDSALFPTSTFLAGEGSRPLVEDGFPKNPNASVRADLLPEGRTKFLDPESWPALGPFPHALDFYGDGSLYVVDAGRGHLPGHINVLVRTSADGGWLYLAGDSAHDWRIINGQGKIGKHAVFGCAHVDTAAAEEHIARIRTLMDKNPRVKVLLAHDKPWFDENKDGPQFWPGAIVSP
ncbi:Metallo-hydrolase/oxidoreductase [Daedaleopsis nitida]|nr:Metallo-hydrolase/oxidoreductase [Daedaleopsis nitida]